MFRSEVVGLIQTTSRVCMHHEAAEHEELSRDEEAPDQASHRSVARSCSGTLNESTNVSVKIGGSRVMGPEPWI